MSKRIIYLLFIFLCLNSMISQAQAPEGINYQAVFRNPNGNIVSGQPLACKIEIVQGNISGNLAYAEKHSVITNQQGIANFVIGQGLTTTGVFSDIDWGNGPFYMKLFVDLDGQGTTFQMEQYGSQMLVSVPYALHAKVADSIAGADLNNLGSAGLSAYEIALQNGFVGTEAEWLASLQGTDGQNGADGQDGTDGQNGADGQDGIDGQNGIDGQDGTNGLSAYEIAVQNGFVGTEAEWLASLQGTDGQDGTDGQNGADGQDGIDGTNGLSAYEIAVQNGFIGTEAEWLASLQGSDGQDGVDGQGGVTEAGLNVNITGSGTPLDPYIIDANPTISTDGTPGNISLNDGGGTLLINVDDADNNATNELNTGAVFNNNILEIQDAGGAVSADLSALDNSGTDDQNASEVFYDNTISGLGGNEVQSAIDQLALDMTTNGVATIRQYTNSDFLSDCATLGSGTWQTIAVIPGISAQSSQVNTRASYAKFQLYDYSAISGGGRSQELLEFNVSRFWDDGQIQLLNHNVPSTTPASIKIEKIRLQYGKVSVGGGSVDCANIQIYRSHTCGNQNNATTNIFVKMTNQIPLTETPLVIIPMELTSTPLSLTNITTDEINILNNNGDDVNDADADPNNEIQDLSLDNNILSLSQSNESVDLSQYLEDPLWMRNSSESHLYPTNLSDNIGLGTNAPSTKLDVVGVLELSNVLPTDPGTDIVRLGDGGTQLQVQTNYGYTRIGPSNSDYAHFYTDRPKYFFDKRIILDEGILSSYNEDLSLQTSGTTRFTIDNDNGNVGIGTSSSNHKLKVVSSGTGDLWPTLGGHIASFKGSGTSNTSVASILIENNNESALYMGVNSSNNTTGAAGAGGAFIGTWSNSSSQKDLLLMTGGTSAIRLKPATSTSSEPARAVVESRLETPGGHLPNYDSGWISASVGNRYTFTHGLASYMLDVTVFIKDNDGNIFNASAGAGVGLDYGGDYEGGMTVYMVTDAQIQIAFGNDAMFTHDNTTISPTFSKITSGEIRVIAYTTGLSD